MAQDDFLLITGISIYLFTNSALWCLDYEIECKYFRFNNGTELLLFQWYSYKPRDKASPTCIDHLRDKIYNNLRRDTGAINKPI